MLSNCGAGKDSWESLGLQGDQTRQSQRKSTLNTHWKDWCWSWSSNTLVTDAKSRLIGKDLDAGKDWGQEEKGETEDEMVGWHHQLNGHEFWASSGRWWRTGKPGMLRSMGLQRVGHYWTIITNLYTHVTTPKLIYRNTSFQVILSLLPNSKQPLTCFSMVKIHSRINGTTQYVLFNMWL